MRSSNKYRVKLIEGARLITIYSGNGLKNFMMSNLQDLPWQSGFFKSALTERNMQVRFCIWNPEIRYF